MTRQQSDHAITLVAVKVIGVVWPLPSGVEHQTLKGESRAVADRRKHPLLCEHEKQIQLDSTSLKMTNTEPTPRQRRRLRVGMAHLLRSAHGKLVGPQHDRPVPEEPRHEQLDRGAGDRGTGAVGRRDDQLRTQ
jgi:hypothetical protein